MTPQETLASLYGEDLALAQELIESESYQIGAQRFNMAMEAKAARSEGADTRIARPLIADLIAPVVEGLEAFLEKAYSGVAGRRHSAAKFLRTINAERAAFIALRVVLNTVTATPPAQATTGKVDNRIVLVAVNMNIGAALEDEARFGRIRDENAKRFNRVIMPNIAKRSGDHFRRAYGRAVEASMVQDRELDPWEHWTNLEKETVGLKLLEIIMATTGLVQLESINPGNPRLHRQIVVLSEIHAAWLNERTAAQAGMVPAQAPMVVPPKPWTSPTSGGYWFNEDKSPLQLVRGSRKRNKRYAEMDLTNVLKSLNTIQDTAWEVNERVLEVAKAVLLMKNPPVKKMPARDPLELPEKLTQEEADDEDRLKAWKKLAATGYRKEKARASRRYKLEGTIQQAEKFSKFERIWFPYSLDFRGRIYAASTSFSPQGSDIDKALLKFADAPEIGTDGVYWLKMHGGNVAGMDKKPLEERVKWVEDNEALIMDIARNPLDNTWWATHADSPFCFLAFCFEYAQWRIQGPTYRCGLAIAFDGSCSGIQHFSAMLQDEVGGQAVNLIPSDKPSDIYRLVADKVNLVIDKHLKDGTSDVMGTITDPDTGEITDKLKRGTKTLAATWRAWGVTRDETKRSVMTLPYGSKKFGFADQLLEDVIQPAIDEHGEDVFPGKAECARYLAGLIWDALGTTVVAAVEAMVWLQKVAGVLTKAEMPCHWITPVGFPVWQAYRLSSDHRIDTVICGSIRVRIMVAANESQEGPKGLDPHKQASGISPNFVHSMDASHLMLTVLEASRQGVHSFACIHDSFGTAPGWAGKLFTAVRECMVTTYTERDVIQDFYNVFQAALTEDQLAALPDFPKKGTLDLTQIRNSSYCFA
ncbi:RNA polymerase [Ralstonia phage RPSC1]|uniref:DNA-directed RNA polymerase n=1 Tax=Ralstonia phage RPSC1 TaxID=2041351 RepID=A0A2Z2UBW2_9CAUD|nr:RNA polymerase [Ralstonia phage RPSC1]ATN92952.1 RNA polymerase-like protein [Ralstonia phage RPSC1]